MIYDFFPPNIMNNLHYLKNKNGAAVYELYGYQSVTPLTKLPIDVLRANFTPDKITLDAGYPTWVTSSKSEYALEILLVDIIDDHNGTRDMFEHFAKAYGGKLCEIRINPHGVEFFYKEKRYSTIVAKSNEWVPRDYGFVLNNNGYWSRKF